ncbi:MAG: acyl-CoA dehydrogenase [Acidimicrobiales bacterium]|nr:acyl-CoA dehydrogenase [Acidimicrobiales bacterium]
MDLELDADQLELRDHARAFLADACPPSLVRGVYEGTGTADGLWKSMVDLGWPALGIDVADDGLGQGFIAEAVLVGELGRVVAPTPYLATVTQLAPMLAEAGAHDVLARIAAGTCTGTLAVHETTAKASRHITAQAIPIGGGRRVLDGTKTHVLDGATADEVAVVVRGGPDDERGLGIVLVPREAFDAEPLIVIDPTMPLATLHLDGIEVDADRVLIEPGSPEAGWRIGLVQAHATVAMAISCVATCRAILEATVEYAKQRHQFGRPIGSFQAIKHRLADLYLAVERADALAWYAACTIAEQDRSGHAPMAAHMAKAAAGDCQRLATRDGLQLHGGIGFTWENDLHFLLKRAVTTAFLFGDAASHRVQLAQCRGLEA